MSKLSPKEQFARFVKAYLVAFLLFVGMACWGISDTMPHSEKRSTEVTLINAYSSMQKCGGKNNYSCEVFVGRFRTADGVVYQREMDGFFYHRYVDEGRKDIPGAYITLSDYDQGYENPWYVSWGIGVGIAMSFIMLFGSIFLAFAADFDVPEAQRKWERKIEEEERRKKYGY